MATKRKISPVECSDDNSPLTSPRGEKLRKSSHSDRLAMELSWASLDSPEESPDRSLVCQDDQMKTEAEEIMNQVNCMQKEILGLKSESSTILSDIEQFNRENSSLREKQMTLRQQIKFNSESVLSNLQSRKEELDEIHQLKRKISELEDNLKKVEEKYQSEKKDFTEKNR